MVALIQAKIQTWGQLLSTDGVNLILVLSFVALLVLKYLHTFILNVLNINQLLKNREQVPSFFEKIVEFSDYKKSVSYSLDKHFFSLISLSLRSGILLLVFFTGFLPWWDGVIALYFHQNYLSQILFTFGILGFFSLTQLPLDIYSIFVLEEKYGFNKQTIKLFFVDGIRQAAVSLILLTPILILIYYFIDQQPLLWWLYSWVALSLFQFILIWLYPVVLAPLFNKFTPLEEGELKERLTALANKTNFPLKGMFVMDGSRHSAHSNAYFTGVGRYKRIVFYDTLIQTLNTNELEAVLAHEIGHYKHKHIKKSMLLGLISSLFGFFVLFLLASFQPFFTLFGFAQAEIYVLIVITSIFGSVFTHFFTPLMSKMSRKHEYEADKYASDITGHPEHLENGLLNLSKNNLSNLTPHPAFAQFYFSHPSLSERITHLRSLKA